MKITVDDLKILACEEGIKDFVGVFPHGIEVDEWTPWCQAIVLGTKMRRWWGWAVVNHLIPMWSLSGANLSWANLSWANLSGAYLSGAYRQHNEPSIPGWIVVDGRLQKRVDTIPDTK